MTRDGLASERWDAEYRSGRYVGEGPVAFVREIAAALDGPRRRGRGLYVGCGNGRNYVPLARSGLDLTAIDASAEAIARLSAREPSLSEGLLCTSLGDFEPGRAFDYVIAIQVFQHGTAAGVYGHFERASALLRPGGLLFLRVNSRSTDVWHRHDVVEEDALGGFTVRYGEGPKKGLCIHFFSREGLEERLRRAGLAPVSGPREVTEPRAPPRSGSWSQWEVVAEKRGP